MVFGESFLSLQHAQTGARLHFNALDALKAWKQEALPPVEVPAAAKWKFRRYLDVAGQKSCNLYLYNGLALFVGWLVARIILFIYFFTHMYFHFDQVKSIFTLGFYSILTVPPVLSVMNVFWFWKIFKGMMKTLSKRRKHSENGKTD